MKAEPGLMETAIRRIHSGSDGEDRTDVLAVEEPLEIRIGFHENGKLTHKPISITMRTPGDDAELAAGFLFTEGIVQSRDQITNIRHCGRGGNPSRGEGVSTQAMYAVTNDTLPTSRVSAFENSETNTIRVDLNEGIEIDLMSLERHFYTTSSCGVCGKSSIEALHTGAKKIENDTLKIAAEIIHRMPEALLARQKTFEKTGGLHASVIFDTKGEIDTIREDVGRHNALDKVIGAKFLAGEMPLNDKVLMVSGRASFELVQKALMAGIPILAAVGAPSSLAVELAREFGMTLVGFVRDDRFNIYTGKQRLQKPARK
jgi:FdhD protein